MTEWKTYRLGEIVATNKKSIGRSYPFSMIKYLDTGSITRNHIESLQEYKLSEAPSRAKRLVQEDDIIYSAVRPNQLHYGYISKFPENLVVSTGFIVISCNKNYIEPKFLYYMLTQQAMTDYLHSIADASTSAYPSLKSSDIENLEISLPSLEEQRRIAGILGAIDDKIENNRRINANLELQAQALFDKIFFDDKDVERNPLSDYANINPTRTIRQGVVARYIEMANLPTKGSFPSDWSYKSYGGGCKFANGDTIMARITPCLENGKTAYIDFLEDQEVAFGSTEYIVISAKSGYCSALFYFLARNKEFVDYAVGHMNGSSGRQRVGGVDIANFPMPHISLEDSNKFAEIAMPIMDVIRNNSLENRHLATLRDTLLPKLMNGELKIGDSFVTL